LSAPNSIPAATADDWSRLAELLPHLRIVHHVRGRLRLRLGDGVLELLAQWPDVAPDDWLARLPGVTALQMNRLAASLVVEYDPRRIPPQWWERLLRAQSGTLPAVLAEVDLPAGHAPYMFSRLEGASA